MRNILLFTSLSVLAACGGRPTGDHVAPDLGTDLGPAADLGPAMDAALDATTDGPVADAATDAHVVDMGRPDIGGEACGSSVCPTGVQYCCAASCNLCLPNSMFCLADPCHGVDAGPHDAGPMVDLGSSMVCGSTICTGGTVCMACLTPFGTTHACLPPGMSCGPVPVP